MLNCAAWMLPSSHWRDGDSRGGGCALMLRVSSRSTTNTCADVIRQLPVIGCGWTGGYLAWNVTLPPTSYWLEPIAALDVGRARVNWSNLAASRHLLWLYTPVMLRHQGWKGGGSSAPHKVNCLNKRHVFFGGRGGGC